VDAAAGLDGRPGVEGQDAVARAERLTAVKPWYRSRITFAFASKSGSRGKIQDWYCHGFTGFPARIRSSDDTDMGALARACASSSRFSSGPLHRDSGTPVSAGSWQASATTAARSASLITRGRPDRCRSSSPGRPSSANRPRHFRAVSTATPGPAAIRAFERPRAASSTICARSRSRQHVFAPRTRFFSVLRSDAVSVTGTAAGSIPSPGRQITVM
jgi:hypothetical protein